MRWWGEGVMRWWGEMLHAPPNGALRKCLRKKFLCAARVVWDVSLLAWRNLLIATITITNYYYYYSIFISLDFVEVLLNVDKLHKISTNTRACSACYQVALVLFAEFRFFYPFQPWQAVKYPVFSLVSVFNLLTTKFLHGRLLSKNVKIDTVAFILLCTS